MGCSLRSFYLGKNYYNLKNFFGLFFAIFLIGFVFAAPILDELHLNIQTTDSQGDVITGTFNFQFNITTDSGCSNVVYSDTQTLATDSRGIISHYLTGVNLNYDNQYYLCYYRDGTLINNSKIARTPYAFRAKYVNVSGIEVDSNLDLGGFNLSADYVFGDGSGLTNLDTSALDLSAYVQWVNLWDQVYNESEIDSLSLSHFNNDILWTATFNSTGDSRWLSSGFSEVDPYWTANYSAHNDSWTTTDSEIWAVAGNGTLALTSYVDSQDTLFNNSIANYVNSRSLSDFTDDILWTATFNSTGDSRWLGSGDLSGYVEWVNLWDQVYNESEVNAINSSMANYVVYVNGTMKDYVDSNPGGYLTGVSDVWVNSSGDNMSGTLNMNWNNIEMVSTLSFGSGINHKIDSNSNGLLFDGGDGTWDFLVYDGSTYMNETVLGYGGSAKITTFNAGQDLELTSNGGDVYVNGFLGVGTSSPGEELDVTGDINATGDICISGGNCLSDMGVGSGDITEVNTNGPYLSGGSVSGAVNLLLDTGALNTTYDNRYLGITDKAADSELLDGLDSTHFYNASNPAGYITSGEVSGNEVDPYWTANYSAHNDSWTSTYNSTYDTWAYNQTAPAITYADNTFLRNDGDNGTGQYDFNGGWTNDGLSIIDGDLYTQTLYAYNISSLEVTNLNVNGSLIPQEGFDNQFDIGSSELRWRSAYFGGDLYVNGTVYSENQVVLTNEVDPYWTGNWSSRTGTGNIVYSNSPTFVTPTLGAATATTLNTGQGAKLLGGGGTITNGDTTYLTTEDQVYDFVYARSLSDFTDDILWTATFNSTGDSRWLGLNDLNGYVEWAELWSQVYNESEVNAINTSMANYVVYVNGTMKDYVDGQGFGTGTVTGSGTVMRVPLWNGTTSLNNSNIYQGANGNVGIGASSPEQELHVNGSLQLTDNVISPDSVTFDTETSVGMRLANPNGYVSITPLNGGWAHIYTDRSNYIFNRPVYVIGGRFASYSTADLTLSAGGTRNDLVIDNPTGNVGIGTTTPGKELEVVGSANVTDTMYIGSSSIVTEINGDVNVW